MRSRSGILAAAVVGLAAPAARGAFHFMQVHQVIGGIDGDTSAQAIQLRLRSPLQCFLSVGAKLVVHDAAGENPILLIEFDQDISNCDIGDHVLIASSAFGDRTDPPAVADFMLANLIPAGYLAAGSITFEEDPGIVYWRLSWGGAGYTGDTTGDLNNDDDGDFGPPWPGPLPAEGRQALRFQGEPLDKSTTNEDDYALTGGPAFFSNNACETFRLGEPCPWDCACPPNDAVEITDLIAVLLAWVHETGGPCDIDGDGDVGIADLLAMLSKWGSCP